MKKLLLTLILLQTILSAQESNLKEIKLQLQWKYQFQFAGFIMAKELGYYKNYNLYGKKPKTKHNCRGCRDSRAE